jgi:WD40 repeat protein
VTTLDFSPDGRRLVTGGGDPAIRLWPLPAPRERLLGERIAGGCLPRAPLALSPDGRLLASGSEGVRLYTLATGERRALSPRAEGEPVFSPDGGLLAATRKHRGGEVLLWRVSDGARLPLDDATAANQQLAFSPDGRLLAFSDPTGGVQLRELGRGGRRVLAHGASPARALAFSPDGSWLAAVGGGELSLWELSTGTRRALAADGPVSPAVAFTAAGWLAAISESGAIFLWEPASGARRIVKPGTPGRGLKDNQLLSAAGGRILIAKLDRVPWGEIHAFDLESGAHTLLTEEAGPNPVVASADGRFLASSDSDDITLWELRSRERFVIPNPAGISWDFAFTADGRLISSGCDAAIRFWSIPPLEPAALKAWLAQVTSVEAELSFLPTPSKGM